MAKKRDITVADVTQIMALSMKGDRKKVYKAVEKLAKQTCDFTMFTVLRYVEKDKQVARTYSSNPKKYPVGGRKPIDPKSHNQKTLEKGNVFIAPNKAEIKRTYFDYELIYSLGITAILNAPISANGRRLGTLALSGKQGMYGKKEIERSKVLAGLLVPVMLAEMDD